MSIPGSAAPFLLASEAAPAAYEIERSLRFNSSDSAYLSRTPASAGNRKTYTFSAWVKLCKVSSQFIFSSTSGGVRWGLYYSSDGRLITDLEGVGPTNQSVSVYRDPSAWYHIVWTVDTTNGTATDRSIIYVNGSRIADNNPIPLGLNSDTNINTTNIHYISRSPDLTWYLDAYLADVHFIDGQALDPTSFTEVSATTGQLIPKAYTGSFGTNGFWLKFSDNSAATATTIGKDYSGNNNNWTPNNLSVRQVVQATYNSTYGSDITSGEAAKIFDGDRSTYGVATGNFIGFSYSGTHATLKVENTSGSSKFFYIQPWVSGSAQNAGTWAHSPGGGNTWTVPANTTAENTFTFPAGYDGVGRIYTDGNQASLRFYDFRTAQQEAAGNDSLVDTPTSYGTDTGAGGEVKGNYCTWNPLNSTSGLTPVNGNLELTGAGGGSTFHNSRGTFALNDAKFYWETVVAATKTYQHWGIVPTDTPLETGGSEALGQTQIPNSVAIVCGTGNIIENSTTLSAGSGALSTNDIIGHAFDGTTGKYWISINGVWRTGNPSAGTTPLTTVSLSRTWLCGVSEASSQTLVANFGQRPFAYPVSGFKALCTTNLPEPVVAKPSTVMDVKLYTGNGSTQTISGLGFSPDLVWIKRRDQLTGYSNAVQDTVRGATKGLITNRTDAEYTYNSGEDFTAFTSDGFSLATPYNIDANNTSATYVAWAWDAGASTVTNTQGSITSSVRANPSAGFSIVTFTGTGANATVGHGLNVQPHLIIAKNRNTANDWPVWHNSLSATNNYLLLNGTSGQATSSQIYNGAPTSSVVNVGDGSIINGSGNSTVMYCFAPVAGYSSAFSYSGSGSSDGPAVWLGFRPRLILIKRSDSTASWQLYDTARGTYNVVTQTLAANESTAESGFTSGYDLDILSTGFKIRAATSNAINSSGGTYIGFAWAESPFQYARAR